MSKEYFRLLAFQANLWIIDSNQCVILVLWPTGYKSKDYVVPGGITLATTHKIIDSVKDSNT